MHLVSVFTMLSFVSECFSQVGIACRRHDLFLIRTNKQFSQVSDYKINMQTLILLVWKNGLVGKVLAMKA